MQLMNKGMDDVPGWDSLRVKSIVLPFRPSFTNLAHNNNRLGFDTALSPLGEQWLPYTIGYVVVCGVHVFGNNIIAISSVKLTTIDGHGQFNAYDRSFVGQSTIIEL